MIAPQSVPSITWSPDGRRLVVKEHNTLSLYDVRSGKSREIVSLATLQHNAVPEPDAPFDWTNRNVAEKQVQWFPDNRRILVNYAGDLFEVDTEKGSFTALTQTADAERDPKLSPDGLRLSFVHAHNIFVLDLASKQLHQLTLNGSPTLLNGQPDWVYPEELGLDSAYWWSPDSRSLAYLQFDVSAEPVFPQAALLPTRAVAEPQRYPNAGDPNADVRLGIVSAAGGPTRWADLGDPRDRLLSRVIWAPGSNLLLAQMLNRTQSKLDLFAANPATGAAHIILHEEDPKWLNAKATPAFTDPAHFIFVSERSGFSHLYLYGIDGKLQRQLTSGNWEVDQLLAADSDRAYFTSTEVSPLERHLYSVALDGSSRRQLTRGEGMHAIDLSPAHDAFLDRYNGLTAAPRSVLNGIDGAEIRVFRQAAETDFELIRPELVTVKTKDGAELYGRLLKPPNFQPGKRYPAIVIVYGGPGSQQIHNQFVGASWEQVLAQRGFVVWRLDNRGSTGRGHAFELPIYHNLGKQELADQREGIDYLVSQGFVDSKRIGMYGWSYGGFMTLYTAVNAPGLLKAAIAGAPVTSWRNYDSIYTERYMGLPQDDPEAYRTTSPQISAANLSGTKLLIVHNVEDDNVHFQNSLQMANALEQAGRQFFMLLYPQKAHGVSGAAQKHLLEETTQFFEDILK